MIWLKYTTCKFSQTLRYSIYSNLDSKQHVSHVCKRLAKTISILQRARHNLLRSHMGFILSVRATTRTAYMISWNLIGSDKTETLPLLRKD